METRGRKKRTLLDAMRAKAWFAGVKEASGLSTAYQVADAFLDEGETEKRNFDKYQRGEMSPSETTLRLVEAKWKGTRKIYDDRPQASGEFFPLWLALSGTMEDLWDVVLTGFDPAFERSRLFGFSQKHRTKRLLSHLLPPGDTIELEPCPTIPDLDHEGMGANVEPAGGYQPDAFIAHDTSVWVFKPPVNIRESRIDTKRDNPIATRFADGKLKLDINSLAATIAIWRLSHFLGECWYEMDTVIRGLTLAPGLTDMRDNAGNVVSQRVTTTELSGIGLVLQPYGIDTEFLMLLEKTWRRSIDKYSAVLHSIPPDRPPNATSEK